MSDTEYFMSDTEYSRTPIILNETSPKNVWGCLDWYYRLDSRAETDLGNGIDYLREKGKFIQFLDKVDDYSGEVFSTEMLLLDKNAWRLSAPRGSPFHTQGNILLV